MTLTQASSALHESFPGPRDEEERGCYYVHPKLHPDLFLMIQKRHVVRIDIDGANTRTSAGIRIGDPVEKVTKVYGAKVEVEPNFYDDQEKYLTVRSPDKRYAVRFETSFGKIAHLYAGRWSAVFLVEGCQ